MPSVQEILETMDYGPSPEAQDAARNWLGAHGAAFGHFIGGAFTAPGAGFDVIAPATDEVLAQATQGSAADIDAAVAAARAAQPGWAALPGHARARHLYALARHIQKRARLFAVLESLNNGKPIREARDIDVPLAVRHFYHHAGWAELVADEFPGLEPQGVCGQIIPWNFPLLMLSWKVAPALAAGNTVVLKPAEYTPLTALLFAEIAVEAGLPSGVLNIVTGDGETGAALVAHQGVDKIAFTGSTAVGRLIRQKTAGTGKALTLELGGKSPFVVFADADLDAAVEGVVDAVWFNQGEVCCAGARLLVQESVADDFTARLRARMARLRVGDPLDKSTDIGAIVHPVQVARINALLARGADEGADLWQPDIPLPEGGSFVRPGLVTGAAPASVLAVEEIFGPIAVMMTFRTFDEAVALANNTAYGLAASVWSENIGQALDMAAQVRAGVVWVNATNLFDAGAPFGGMRESGFGREGGRVGLRDYLRLAEVVQPDRATPQTPTTLPSGTPQAREIDRTPKLYIGGKQARPDGGHSYCVTGADGAVLGQVPLGNRKDIRNAVEAAHKAGGWAGQSGHGRAQVLYFIAENLSARAAEFTSRLAAMGAPDPEGEVLATIARAFYYAAWADKFDSRVHATQSRHITLAMHEPFGVMGVICPEVAPLLGFASLVLPAIAMGNRVVAVPSQGGALAVCDLYQVFDTSDLPGGVVNIVTGAALDLARTLAEHDDVAALWYAGPDAGRAMVEGASSGNLKPVWVPQVADWARAQGADFLNHATQVKTIWVPYGA
jgi:aldehyde dehydrogenase (NAD+)